MTREEFVAEAAEAARLLEKAPDAAISAHLACAKAFEYARYHMSAEALGVILRESEDAAAYFASHGDFESESEAFDALASVHRGLGDWNASIEVTRRRLANLEHLSRIERVDAWGVLAWSQVFAGQYEEAIGTFRAEIGRAHV